MSRRTALRVGAWNLKVGRNREVVAREVAGLLAAEDLDVLAVVEAAWYDDHLEALEGYRYLTSRNRGRSGRDAGLLVREGLRVRRYRLGRTETTWPRRKYAGTHWPRSFPSVVVEGVRITAVHLPPGPHDNLRNRLAYAEGLLRLGVMHAGRGPVALLGDWNKRPDAVGPFTPVTLAEALGGRFVGRTIDHGIIRGLIPGRVRYLARRGSDHRPFVATVRLEEDQ